MSTQDVPAQDQDVGAPEDATPPNQQAAAEITPETSGKTDEVAVEISDIKASGLPAKVGFFGGVFFVSVKGGSVSQKTKKVKYTKGDEFVASWGDTVKLSGLEASKVELEIYAKKFPFLYKVIKKTESKANLSELLEHSATPVELELSEEGQTAGKLVFRIREGSGAGSEAGVEDETPPPAPDALGDEPTSPEMLPTSISPTSPEQLDS